MVYIKKCGKLRKHGMYREREASEELGTPVENLKVKLEESK